MTIELTEKFIGFVDIMGFKSLMTRVSTAERNQASVAE
jgi:hypothetical protein